MSCHAQNSEEKQVSLKNLSGTSHKMRVFSDDILAARRDHICELFQMLATYSLKLIGDDGNTMYVGEGSKPKQTHSLHGRLPVGIHLGRQRMNEPAARTFAKECEV